MNFHLRRFAAGLFALAALLVFAACGGKRDTEYTVSVSGGTGGGTFYAGETCTVTAAVGEREEFAGWTENGVTVSLENPYTFTVERDVSLVAVKCAVYRVTVENGTGGGTFYAGETCTVTAAVPEGTVFDGWSVNGGIVSLSDPYSFTVDRDVTVKAVIKQKVTAGVLARKWFCKGGVLDLAAGTFSLMEGFRILSVAGEGRDTVVSCAGEDGRYVLSLNGEGMLEMRAPSQEAPVYTFMADAAEFAGLWTVKGERIYTLFLDEPDVDGWFGWTVLDDDGSCDYIYRAKTALTFEGNAPRVTFTVAVPNLVFEFEDGKLVLTEDGTVYVPTAALFGTHYAGGEGTNLIFDHGNGTLSWNGQTAKYTIGNGIDGAGIFFGNEGAKTALVYTLDGLVARGENGVEYFTPYDLSWLVGNWYGGDEITVPDVTQIVYGGAVCELQPVVDGAEIYYAFTAEGEEYRIRAVAGNAVAFELFGPSGSVYYVSEGAIEKFAGDYYNLEISLSVNTAGEIVLGAQSFQGTFTLLPDLERGEVPDPSGMEGLGQVALAIGESDYLIRTGAGSLARITRVGGSYTAVAGYYSQSARQALEEKFLAGLMKDGDVYTAGAEGPVLSVDFTAGTFTLNDEGAAFVWSYFMKEDTGMETACAVFRTREGEEYTVYPYIDAPYLCMRASSKEYSLVSRSLYGSLLGTSYVKEGEIAECSISFAQDGTLTVVSTDTGDSAEATRTEIFPYLLTREKSGKLVVTYLDGVEANFSVPIFCEEIGLRIAVLTDVYLSRGDSAVEEAAGVYYDGGGVPCVELFINGQFRYDGEGLKGAGEETFDSLTVAGGVVTGVKTYRGLSGTSTVTMKFENGTVRVSDGGEKDYERRTLTPKSFVSAFSARDGQGGVTEVKVTAYASGVNEPVSLEVTVNGGEADGVELGFDGELRQTLAFQANGGEYRVTLEGDTLTLSRGGTAFVSGATADRRDWDYSKFAFEGEMKFEDDGEEYFLSCNPKAGGKMPVYTLRYGDGTGIRLKSYRVGVGLDGTMTLDITLLAAVRVTVSAGGTLGVGFVPYED